MFSLRALLLVSLAANLALLFALTRFSPHPAARSTTFATAKAPAAPLPAVSSWTKLSTSDLDEFSHRLHAAGFSRVEIRAIMELRIREKFPFRPAGDSATSYWRSSGRDDTDPKVMAESQVNSREFSNAWVKYIVPGQIADDPDEFDAAQRRFGNLTLEKLQALRTLQGDYQRLVNDMYAAPKAPSGIEAHKAYQLIEKERLADFAKLLTPAEYADYELRSSDTAMSLRMNLETFRPTEAEYKTLFAVQKTFEDKLNAPSLAPEVREAVRKKWKAASATALPLERAADLLAISASGNDATAKFMARLDLPLRTYTQVVSIRDDVTQRASVVRADSQLSDAARAAQLAALAQEARAKLTTTLGGERGFEAYNDMKGDWIRALGKK